MSSKENILRMIKENAISLKEGLNMIANMKKYYVASWAQKEIESKNNSLSRKNIFVITDYASALFSSLQKSNTLFFEQDFEDFSDYKNADIIIVFLKNRSYDMAKNILSIYKDLISQHIELSDFYYLYEENEVSPVNEAMGSLFRSLHMEKSEICFHSIQMEDKDPLVEFVQNEFGVQNDIQVKYDHRSNRFIKDVISVTKASNNVPFRDNATYVLSGGTGAIGKILLKELSKRYKSNYILLGRSEANQEIRALEREYSTNGSNVVYFSCDITDKNEMKFISTKIKSQYGDVNGVIHLAAVLHDGMAVFKTEKDFLEVIDTKVLGAENLYQNFRSEKLEFITFCSSISALTGNIGQCDYSYANAYIEALALKINQQSGKKLANAVGFPLWENGGLKPAQNIIQSKGISDQEGIDIFMSGYGFDENVIYYIEENTLKVMKSVNEKDISIDVKDYKDGKLNELTEQYLIKVIANEMKISEDKLTVVEDLNEIGLDSIMVMEITKNIEKDLGSISKTLFFEFSDIRSLVRALIKSKRNKLEVLFADKLHTANRKAKEVIVPEEVSVIHKPIKNKIEKKVQSSDIAIVGMAGRYPMSNDMEEFWNNLSSGKDCIVEIPKERWDYRKYFDPNKETKGKSYSKWGGFIDDYDRFDPLFFKISPREADYLDPQERVFLETAWETMEDAGYTRDELKKYKVGVFVGVMYGHYQLYNVEEGLRGELPVQSSSYSSIANRVSYALNLQGASLAIDTMCSSSLTAIHIACQSIREGESDMALVGGINISSHPLKYIMLSQQKFLSTDGRCRSFGEGGDGYVPGEGSGAVLLKSLEQAENDGDRIYAVIKGSGLNHGGKTRGYSVPNPVAQTAVIKNTLDKYDIDARSINYIETHGTGTALGDPIEISGLTNAFGDIYNNYTCAIGSIKSNIGHTESASGIAAISKVILQMNHKQLVPSIHADKLNPNIEFDSIPFYVQRKLEEWKPAQIIEAGINVKYPRRAGINSFGAGGSNAFVIMEEYEEKRKYDEISYEVLFVLSAKTEERLRAYAAKIQRFITKKTVKKGYSTNSLADLLENELVVIFSNSIQIPKEELDPDAEFESLGLDYITLNQIVNRVCDFFMISEKDNVVGVSSIKELADTLIENYEEDIRAFFGTVIEEEESELPKLYEMAYMLQVGREQYENRLAIIVSSYEELNEKLSDYLTNKELQGVYKTQPNETNDIIASLLKGTAGENFIKNLFDNHELDKLAIMWCNGYTMEWKKYYDNLKIRKCSLPTYPFKRELHWLKMTDKQINVETRIFPMLDDFVLDMKFDGVTLKKCLKDTDAIVTDHMVNNQMVLPGVGYIEMVYEALGKIGKAGQYDIDSIYWLLPVYVKERTVIVYVNIAGSEQNRKFEIYTIENDKKVLHCKGNLVSKDASTGQMEWSEIKSDYQDVSGEQLYELFADAGITYRNMYRGIQNVKFAKNKAIATIKVKADTENYNLFPGLADSALQSIAVLNQASGKTNIPYFIGKVRLYKKLENISKVYTKNENGRISTVVTNESGEVCLVLNDIVLRELATKSENILYYPVWKEMKAVKKGKLKSSKAAIIYYEEFEQLAEKLENDLKNITVMRISLTTNNDESEKIKEILKDNTDINEIFFLNGLNNEVNEPEDEAEFSRSQEKSITSFYHLVKELLDSNYSNQNLRLYVVTNNTVIVKDYNNVNPYASVLHGFTLSLDKEMSKWFIKCMDVDLFYDNEDNAVSQIISEREVETSSLIVYRENVRFIREIHPINVPAVKRSSFEKNGVYMIFGGAGGIGGVLALHLAKTHNANIVLIGRRAIDDKIQERLLKIKQNGGDAIYVQANLGKYDDIKNAIAVTKEKFGKINGVIHSALVLNDKTVRTMTEEVLYSTLESKVTGSVLLNKAFRKEEIDFMLYFSSANSLISAAGQSNYSAACTFEDAYAEYQGVYNSYDVKRINWGYWGSVGVVSSDKYNKNLSKNGILSIEPEEGMQVIEQLIANDVSVLVPYKANKQMLNTLGIRLDQIAELNSGTEIDELQIFDNSLTDEQKIRIQQRTDTFLKFEGVGGLLLLDKFQRMGYFKTASKSITIEQMKKEIGVISRYDRMFMALISMLQRYKYVKIKNNTVTALPLIQKKETVEMIESLQENVENLAVQYPEIKPYINLIKVCVEAYPEVLSGKVSHMSVMFPNGSKKLVENIYTGNVLTDLFNTKMAELVKGYVRDVLAKNEQAKIRILEVGAGTGGTSGFIMKEIKPYENNVVYTYTDISKSFIEFGRKKFGSDYPFVEFKVLNVEEDTAQKRAEFGEYDIVIATNVLHATKMIDNTLLQLKKLMKKGAWMIVNEVTAIQDYATLTFGLTDGWWAYEDEFNRLPLSPLLDTKRWQIVMRNNGLFHFSSYGIKGKGDYNSEQSLLISQNDGISFVEETNKSNFEVSEQTIELPKAVPTPKLTEKKKVPEISSAQKIQDNLRHIFSTVLNIDENDVNINTNVSDYGVDSLVSMEVNTELDKYYRDIPATFIFEHPTISEMVAFIKDNHLENEAVSEVGAENNTALPSKPTEIGSLVSIKNNLIEILSRVLNINKSDIGENTPLEEYGVDSLVSMEVNKELEKYYSDVPVTLILDHPTISEMAAVLRENHVAKDTIAESIAEQNKNRRGMSIKFVNSYPDLQSEDFYMFWNDLDTSNGLNEYINSLPDIKRLSSLNDSEIGHIIVRSEDFDVEVLIGGTGKTVVFIPGFGVTGVQWRKQLEFFKKGCRVIVLHLPGVGLSSFKQNLTVTLEDMADSFMKVLSYLGINDEINLVASSFGTMVAQQMAYKYKANIKSLVAISGFTSIDTKFENISISDAMEKDTKDLDEADQEMIKLSNYINSSFEQYLDYVKAGKEYSTEEILNNIDVKTLVLYGEKDTVIAQSMFHNLISRIKDSRSYSVKDAGHILNWTNADEVNDTIMNFINEIS